MDTKRNEDDDSEILKGRKILAAEQSSQKKNISYFSFKNIRDRYQFKDQRTNKIQMRNEQISKNLISLEKTVNSDGIKKNK